MGYSVCSSASTLVWAALIACYLQAGWAVNAEETVAKQSEDSNAQMEMSKRDWNRNLHSWGKRAWQNLQGGWGKRDMGGPANSYPLYLTEKRAWQNLQGGWGKRFSPQEEEYAMKLAQILDEDEQNQQQQLGNSVSEYVPESQPAGDFENEDEKRAWNALNGGWGKRAEWGNFRGSWGKRDPAWTNLKGIWGKRSLQERIAQ